ncbi:hypothetical protein [Pseudoalteromonas fuliginea]|uniref:RiboL-PSP-HEPN domain-containing protein n=1 Tax=Pseudoalteromonas fuliginea TaxID=1872678 RepID=A0ABD3Y9D4_9GAMM|nr:hypothetical protein [Pseudoalteromonas fuliginea]KDC51034.1 hypothetical protein DC53_10870 [Pseudoalteromonas fuliginea]KJZ28417.1 hypothetical protein TW82_07885 [Pseudoalteromonas fuliginea]
MFKGYYRKYIFHRIDELKRYIEFSNKLLCEKLEKEKIDNALEIAQIEDEFYKEKFLELAYESENELKFDYSSMHWSSIFITQYSYIEHILDEICEFYAAKTGAKLKLKDLNGAGIERAKNYISKFMGLPEPFGKAEWGRIKDYAKIRNKIIHAGLYLDQDLDIDKQVIKIISKINSVSLERFYHHEPDDPYDESNNNFNSILYDPKLELNADFLNVVVTDYDKFFDHLFDELEKLVDKNGKGN